MGSQGPCRTCGELIDYLDNLGAGARDWDHYGEGGPVAELETRVANLVGKPAAAMFPSGVMAQQVMLRVWCEQRGSSRVALPDLSHLLPHELDGPLCAKRGWRWGCGCPDLVSWLLPWRQMRGGADRAARRVAARA